MNCKNCIHCEGCLEVFRNNRDKYPCSEEEYLGGCCSMFTDKSEWVHIPCKLWDTVWAIWHEQVIETQIMSIKYIINSKVCGFWIGTVVDSFSGWLNKDVFLTKEEAEKALAERDKQ